VSLTQTQFDALCERLDRASTTLRNSGSFLQAIARRYYLVRTIAEYAALRHGVTVAHRDRHGNDVESGDFSHNAIPDLIRTLYTGMRSGNVGPPKTDYTGLVGTRLRERDAVTYANRLQIDRKWADYGYTDEVEPYSAEQAEERLNWANFLAEDLLKALRAPW
jgi:hypothetical protein